MRASSIVFFLSACSTALVAADVNAVISALNKLTTDLKTLDADVKKVTSGVFGIGSCLQASVDTLLVDDDINAVTTAVQASSKFSAADSQKVIASIDQVTAQSGVAINDTISQLSNFGGLSPVVLAALYQFKGDSTNLGFAFASKLDSSAINAGVKDLTALQNSFNQAIVAYGGQTS